MKRKMFGHEEVNEWSEFRTFAAFVTDGRSTAPGTDIYVDYHASHLPWPFDRISLCIPATGASSFVGTGGGLRKCARRRRPPAGSLLLL